MSGPQASPGLKEGDKTHASNSAIKQKVIDDTGELEIKGKKKNGSSLTGKADADLGWSGLSYRR